MVGDRRFVLAAMALAAVARWKGQSLRIGYAGLLAAVFLGFTQFCVNFNAVYLAEEHITSGVVATVFALLLIPATLMAWASLDHRPSKGSPGARWSRSAASSSCSRTKSDEHPADSREVVAGIGLALLGMLGAAIANVVQARPEIRRFPLLSLLAWSMAAGALIDGLIAFVLTGPPVLDSRPAYWLGVAYLALFASVLTFGLYYPVVRRIGPAKAAYSSVLVPIIAMGFSTCAGPNIIAGPPRRLRAPCSHWAGWPQR